MFDAILFPVLYGFLVTEKKKRCIKTAFQSLSLTFPKRDSPSLCWCLFDDEFISCPEIDYIKNSGRKSVCRSQHHHLLWGITVTSFLEGRNGTTPWRNTFTSPWWFWYAFSPWKLKMSHSHSRSAKYFYALLMIRLCIHASHACLSSGYSQSATVFVQKWNARRIVTSISLRARRNEEKGLNLNREREPVCGKTSWGFLLQWHKKLKFRATFVFLLRVAV